MPLSCDEIFFDSVADVSESFRISSATTLKPMPEGSLFEVGHYVDHELVSNIEHDCDLRIQRIEDGKPVRFLMTVGGAGAGADLYIAMTYHLLRYIKQKKASLIINFGDHMDMWEMFNKKMRGFDRICRTFFDDYEGLHEWADTLDGNMKSGVYAVYNKDIFEAVYSTNLLMRKCDVLVTKPSELSFYPVPKLMIPVSLPPLYSGFCWILQIEKITALKN